MTYDFHPEARLEYREAASFYDSNRSNSHSDARNDLVQGSSLGRILFQPLRT